MSLSIIKKDTHNASSESSEESKSKSISTQSSNLPVVASDLVFDDYLVVPTANAGEQFGDILEFQNDHDHDNSLLTVKFHECKWHPHHVDLPARLRSFASPDAKASLIFSLSSTFFMPDKSLAGVLSVSKCTYVKLATSSCSTHYRKRLALCRGTALAMRHIGLPFSLTEAGFKEKLLSRLQTPFDAANICYSLDAINVQAGLLECKGSGYLGWNPAASDSHQNWLFLVEQCPWILFVEELYQGSTDCHTVVHTYDFDTIRIRLDQENCYNEGVCDCKEYPFFHYKSPFECCSDLDYDESDAGEEPEDKSIVLWHRQ